MTLPAPTASKLSKLLSMLDSDHDAEAVAAARAISRVLKSATPDQPARAAPRDVVRIAGKPCRISPALRDRIQRMVRGTRT